MSSGLAVARDAKTILFTTYKRDGTPVPTPARPDARLAPIGHSSCRVRELGGGRWLAGIILVRVLAGR